jgi:GT2 family glycosyltransferase/peptidoglycan/xylan/chitin deacetylase (PgdA/CDA1 family)
MNTTASHIPPDVSIIIPTKDRHDSMLITLKAVLSSVPNDTKVEIVVIEETNNPQPVEDKGVKYYSIPERGFGFGFGRNFGLRRASGKIVVFLDDDVKPAENWLENLLAPFQDSKIGAVGGAILPDLTEINTVGKCISFLGFPAGGLTRYIEADGRNYEARFISTGNCAFRANLARQIGGFDVLLRWGGEDQDFFSRMSLLSKTVYVPDAMVFHKQRDSLRNVLKWFIRRGTGEFFIRCMRGHPLLSLVFPLRRNFSLKLCVFLLACLLVFLFSPLAMFLFILGSILFWNRLLWQREHAVLYLNADNDRLDVTAEHIRKAITTKDVKRMLFLVKLTMDMGHEIGLLIGFLRYINHRVFSKPFVLNLHHLGDLDRGISPDNAKYYYSKERFWEILEDSEGDGRLLVPLSDIIRRLKENPVSLYFGKILCITFDDASLSIYEPMKQLLAQRGCAFTIFLPTGLTGGVNKWDMMKGFRQEKIMSWEQVKHLILNGAEIGSHTRHHVRLLDTSKDKKINEIKESMEDLQKNIPGYEKDKEIVFSYPYGEYDQEIIKILKESGYIGAVANYEGNIRPGIDLYQIPRFSLSAEIDWRKVCRKSRSFWFKELLKDIRDWISD